jgi:glycosyltransferase involved in cell wall biosynthesis
MIHDLASFDPDGPRWLGRAHAMRIRSSINNSVRRAKVLLAPSAFTQRRIAERYSLDPGSILIAPNAVDPKLAQLIDNASPLTRPARSRVLAVGNVLPRKNLEMLAQAIGLLRSQGINLELRVVGQVGSDGAAIRAELERRLGDAVSFSGYVTPEGLASEYRSGDLLAFPSLHEGFGIPALEAMYAGLPVIASSAAGLREVVDGAGIVIPPDDPALWADRIGHVLSDDATAAELVERGRRRAAEVTWRESAEAVCTALLIASGQAADAGSAA